MACTTGCSVTQGHIVALSGQACYKALIPANITAGFSKTGIYPTNREVFTDDLLLPSVPTDREADPARDMPGEGPGEEANGVAVTRGHAGGAQSSTSTAASTPKSPDDIRP